MLLEALGDTVVDEVTYVPRSEIEARLQAFDLRLGNVEKASQAMQAEQATLTAALHANSEKLDSIFQWVTKANGVAGFARRHGPRIAAFALGIAVTKGWVTAENGRNFLHIFGM